jgi:hypothetical protein
MSKSDLRHHRNFRAHYLWAEAVRNACGANADGQLTLSLERRLSLGLPADRMDSRLSVRSLRYIRREGHKHFFLRDISVYGKRRRHPRRNLPLSMTANKPLLAETHAQNEQVRNAAFVEMHLTNLLRNQ